MMDENGRSNGFRLPTAVVPLRGRAWVLFLVLWVPTLMLALIGAGYAALDVSVKQTPPHYLIGLTMTDGPKWTLGPPVGNEAMRAGIRKGDRLIAVNGRPVAADAIGLIDQISGPVGGALTITVAHADGRRIDHRLTRTPEHFREGLATAGLSPIADHVLDVLSTYVLGALLPIALAVLLLAQRPRDPLAPWTSLMMLLLAIGNGAIADWLFLSGPTGARVTGIANEIGFDLMVFVLALAPEGRFRPRGTWAVVLLAPLAIHLSGYGDRSARAVILLAAVGAAVAMILVRYRSMPQGQARQQIRWTVGGFCGSLVALAALALIQYVKPSIGTFAAKEWAFVLGTFAATLTTTVIELGLTIALLRYRLYDADVTISRSIAYGALTVMLIGSFATTQKLVEKLSVDYVGGTLGDLAQAVAAGLAAVLVVPVNRRVSRWAENHFQGGLVHLRDRFPRRLADLRETVPPEYLARVSLTEIRKGVRAVCGAVVLQGKLIDTQAITPGRMAEWLDHWNPPEGATALDCVRADPLLPMRIPLVSESVGEVGWLLLGPRPDGSFYGRDERAALIDVADPLTRALAITIERREREAAREADVGMLRSAIAELHERLGWLEGRAAEQQRG